MARTIKRLRLAGYIRVSHVGGRDGEGFRSPDDQRETINEYATRHGHTVTMFAPDLDESDGRESRPNLDLAVAAIESGDLDGIIIAYGSRFMRNVRAALSLWDRIEIAGGQYVDIVLDIDTTTPEGRLVRTQLAAIAEYELDRHRHAFDRLKRETVARGVWAARVAPVGYVRDPETRKLVLGPRAPDVVWAFEQRAAGATIADVARGLGITANGLRRVMVNRAYLGELQHGPYINPAAHPPLVTPELFEATAARVGIRPPRSKAAHGPRLCSGVLRCASCGHMMSRSGPEGAAATYRCPTHFGIVSCPAPAGIRADRIEKYVTSLVLHELTATHGQRTPRRSALDELDAEARAALSEIQAYVVATQAAKIGAEVFAAGLTARQERLDAADIARRTERARDGAATLVLGGVEAWDRLDAAGRNDVVRAMFRAVAVARGSRGRRIPVEDRVVAYSHAATFALPRRGMTVGSIVPIILNPDDPHALRIVAT